MVVSWLLAPLGGSWWRILWKYAGRNYQLNLFGNEAY